MAQIATGLISITYFIILMYQWSEIRGPKQTRDFFYLQTDQAQNIIVTVLALSVWVLSQQIEAETTQF